MVLVEAHLPAADWLQNSTGEGGARLAKCHSLTTQLIHRPDQSLVPSLLILKMISRKKQQPKKNNSHSDFCKSLSLPNCDPEQLLNSGKQDYRWWEEGGGGCEGGTWRRGMERWRKGPKKGGGQELLRKVGNKRRRLKGEKQWQKSKKNAKDTAPNYQSLTHFYMSFVSMVKTWWLLEKQQSNGSAAPVVFSLEQAGPSQTGLTEIEEVWAEKASASVCLWVYQRVPVWFLSSPVAAEGGRWLEWQLKEGRGRRGGCAARAQWCVTRQSRVSFLIWQAHCRTAKSPA